MPSDHGGDWGIDGFIYGQTLFQFYGDEAGAASKARYERQRDKLTRDLNKLRDNAADIAPVVGDGISTYTFLVSIADNKALLEHARAKATEVIGWNLGYLADNFNVLVKDFRYLAAEWDLFYSSVAAKLDLGVARRSDADVVAWSANASPLLATLDAKLDVIAPPTKRDAWASRLVRRHLAQLDLLEALKRHRDVWLRVREINGAREDDLEFRAGAQDPRADVVQLAEQHRARLSSEVSSLGIEDTDDLAWGAVADWLMRCPLDYREL